MNGKFVRNLWSVICKPQPVSRFMISIIRIYQRVAPSWIRRSCRYTPTCSEYAILVIRERGPAKGFILALFRIMRCIPPFGGTDWPSHHQEGDTTCSNKVSDA